jgi:FAD-dependent urate hydroxylase
VPIRVGLAVERLAQRDGIVSVEFSDATSGEYDLVVGADGIQSAVRRLTFDPMLGHRTAFLTLPIDDERMYCNCDVVSPPDHGTPERGPNELFSQFADPAATLLDSLDAAADIHVSTIEEVALDHWAHERVVLIGDAAHATSPNMAQGAAMALEDALVLADCLHKMPAIPNALAAFQARRRPRTDWVRAITPATCQRRSGTTSCESSVGGSSTPTTVRC